MNMPSSSPLTAVRESAEPLIRIDPAANAALAEAIRSARQTAPTQPLGDQTSGPDKAVAARGRSAFLGRTALALLIASGWCAFALGTLSNRDTVDRMEAETARSQEILAKLTDDLAALKTTMAATRDVEHTASTSSAADQAKLAAAVERLAVAVQEPAKKLASLEERLGRMEGQITESLNAAKSASAASASAPDNTSAFKAVRTDPVDGWVLREVYKGSALVESRSRGLYEVMPGNVIPGVGRVEAIERRGARWVVVTDKGFIGTYR
ncbi:hypothetical protein [Microvirga solisilvae]|uniref:hypothetical protein n=1 Tax=Microvirga solisilvae TaxID=2919498 RepID=UPI001FAF1AAA|nr:hypothetical protein [Microvirga solisilvae]